MSTQLNPYLNFNGTAREAMQFYADVFGGELVLTTFADFGGMGIPEAEQAGIMHGQLNGPDGWVLMGSDVPSHMGRAVPSGFSVSLSGDDATTLRGWWTALGEGATVTMPLEVAPWGDAFGTLTDRFGIDWLINIAVAAPE